jgi:hypothetical protein
MKTCLQFKTNYNPITIWSSFTPQLGFVRLETALAESDVSDSYQHPLVDNDVLARKAANCELPYSPTMFLALFAPSTTEDDTEMWCWSVGSHTKVNKGLSWCIQRTKGLTLCQYNRSTADVYHKRRGHYFNMWLTELTHFQIVGSIHDRLCGLVARVPGYRSRGPGSIPDTSRFSEQ